MRFLKHSVQEFIASCKELHGKPHYVSMGMATGIFVSITPTIPFHTAIALALAVVLRGSKRAAAIGVWFCNPVTLPFIYYADYKIGLLFIDTASPFNISHQTIMDIVKLGLDVFYAMLAGGLIIGIIAALISYFVTYLLVKKRS